jgi:hypothetical protein
MSKALSLTLLFAGLTLTGIAGASASQIGTVVDGDINVVRATGYGHGPRAGLSVEGDANDVEFFAGPCPGRRPSQTVLHGSGQRRVLIAPCILD